MLASVCDKDAKRSRCGTVTGVATCPYSCGKQYARCAGHGGQAGADRSLRGHLTMFGSHGSGCPECGKTETHNHRESV